MAELCLYPLCSFPLSACRQQYSTTCMWAGRDCQEIDALGVAIINDGRELEDKYTSSNPSRDNWDSEMQSILYPQIYLEELNLRYPQHMYQCYVYVMCLCSKHYALCTVYYVLDFPSCSFSCFPSGTFQTSFHLSTFKSFSCDLFLDETNLRYWDLFPTLKKEKRKSKCHHLVIMNHLVLVMNSILTDSTQSYCLRVSQLSFAPNPTWPQSQSHSRREQCGVELTMACAVSVFHLSRLPWELVHGVDIKQHLAGLM